MVKKKNNPYYISAILVDALIQNDLDFYLIFIQVKVKGSSSGSLLDLPYHPLLLLYLYYNYSANRLFTLDF